MAAAAILGCASEKMAVNEVAPPEVLIETAPNGARVIRDGVELGSTPWLLKVANAAGTIVVELHRENYLGQTLKIPADEVVKGKLPRVVVPLRPGHWDARGRPIPMDDAAQIARAGAEVSKTGRCDEALQYFRYALQLDPRTPSAHKGMGICYAKMGERTKAVRAYKQYLLFAPQAPDAPKVQKIVSEAQGDIELGGE